jgi:hypothetical protein
MILDEVGMFREERRSEGVDCKISIGLGQSWRLQISDSHVSFAPVARLAALYSLAEVRIYRARLGLSSHPVGAVDIRHAMSTLLAITSSQAQLLQL